MRRVVVVALCVTLLVVIPTCDGAFSLIVENRRSEGVEVIVDRDRNWGWVEGCTAYDFGPSTIAPGRQPIQVTALNASGVVVHDETFTVDAGRAPRISVTVSETTPGECQSIRQSRYPTPHPRPNA